MIGFFAWFIRRKLEKDNCKTLEVVIRDDGWTFRRRNLQREEMVQRVLAKIK